MYTSNITYAACFGWNCAGNGHGNHATVVTCYRNIVLNPSMPNKSKRSSFRAAILLLAVTCLTPAQGGK